MGQGEQIPIQLPAIALASFCLDPHNREGIGRNVRRGKGSYPMGILLLLLVGYISVLLTKSSALFPMDMLNLLQPSGWLGLFCLLFLFSWFLGE